MVPEAVELIDVDSEIQPDNSFPEAYAIYVILSHEPSAEWQREFARICQLRVATRKRVITVVGSRLRIVVSPTDHLETVLRHVQAAVHQTNASLEQSQSTR